MNLKITFHFLIYTLITLVSGVALASPAGIHNSHNSGKPKVISYISPAGLFTCSLNELGWIYCWGANSSGQIGNNTTSGSVKPIPIRSGFIQLDTTRSAGGSSLGTTYGITLTGVLMSWGDNVFGKMGTGSDGGASFTPQVVDPSIRYKYMESQYRHSCAITTTNVLKCWGYNSDGELGDGTTAPKNSPTTIDSGVNYKTVAAGAYHTCGITTGNILKCWGLNDDYQLGDGTNGQKLSPVTVDGGTTYASASAGLTHTCAITMAGALRCWGNDSFGQIGDGGLSTSRSTPYTIDSGTSYAMVAAGDNSTCAITTTGVLKCWGENSSGQLGDNSTTTRTTPVIIDSGVSYSSVTNAGTHTCGITSARVMKCWGLNDYGQLGIGIMGGIYTTPQVVVAP